MKNDEIMIELSNLSMKLELMKNELNCMKEIKEIDADFMLKIFIFVGGCIAGTLLGFCIHGLWFIL